MVKAVASPSKAPALPGISGGSAIVNRTSGLWAGSAWKCLAVPGTYGQYLGEPGSPRSRTKIVRVMKDIKQYQEIKQ